MKKKTSAQLDREIGDALRKPSALRAVAKSGAAGFLGRRGAEKWTAGANAGASMAGRDLRAQFGARSEFGGWGSNELSAADRATLSVAADALDEGRDDTARVILRDVRLDIDDAHKRWESDKDQDKAGADRRGKARHVDHRKDFNDAYLATVMTFIGHVMPGRS